MSHNNPYDDIPSPEDMAASRDAEQQRPQTPEPAEAAPDPATGEMTSEYSDAFARDQGQFDDLANMYVRREKPTSDSKLVIREGLPEGEEEREGPNTFLRILVALLIASAITFGLYKIEWAIVDIHGEDVRRPIPVWLLEQVTMPNDQRVLQHIPYEHRAIISTYRRMPIVYDAAMGYFLQFNTAPRSSYELVEMRMIEHHQASDGWGTPFEIILDANRISVRSAGEDRSFNTADDVVADTSGVTRPAKYESILMMHEWDR